MGLAVVLVSMASQVWAQAAKPAYKQLPLNPDKKVMGELQTIAADVLRGQKQLEGNQPSFERFFKEFHFPQFTAPANLTKLPRLRREFKQKYLWAAKNTAAHTLLNKLTLTQMQEIASDTYHPYARYNAMLIIADLNDKEPTATTPGVPYRPALDVMVNSKVTDGPRVAALIGILRHAEAKLPPEQRATVLKEMQTLLAQATPPAGRSEDGHNWMRRRAADVLIAMGETVPAATLKSLEPKKPVIEEEDLEAEIGAATATKRTKLKTKTAAGGLDEDELAKKKKRAAVDDPLGVMQGAEEEEEEAAPRAKPATKAAGPADEIEAALSEEPAPRRKPAAAADPADEIGAAAKGAARKPAAAEDELEMPAE